MSGQSLVTANGFGAEVSAGPGVDVADYFLCQWGKVYGPASLTVIAGWIGDGRVTPRDWLFVPSICDWAPILEVPEMAGCFYATSEKPAGPPPGVPVDVFLKFYKSQEIPPLDPNVTTAKLIEKRQWVRIPVRASVTFRVVRDFAPMVSTDERAYTANISEGGMGLEWAAPLDVGTLVEIEADFFPMTLQAQARVVHCFRKTRDVYYIGTSFKHLPDGERDKIREFIRSSLHSASRGTPTGNPL